MSPRVQDRLNEIGLRLETRARNATTGLDFNSSLILACDQELARRLV